jgi:acyl carrier protein
MSSRTSAQDGSTFDQLLTDSFIAGLDLPDDTDVTTLAFGQHQHWDSLGHLSLVVALETAFGVSLDRDDVLAIDTYAAAAAVLRSKSPSPS